MRDDALGDRGGEHGVPGGDHPHGLHQLPGRGVLQEEPRSAQLESTEDVFVEVEGGQDQDPGVARGARLGGGWRSARRRRASARPSAPRPARAASPARAPPRHRRPRPPPRCRRAPRVQALGERLQGLKGRQLELSDAIESQPVMAPTRRSFRLSETPSARASRQDPTRSGRRCSRIWWPRSGFRAGGRSYPSSGCPSRAPPNQRARFVNCSEWWAAVDSNHLPPR